MLFRSWRKLIEEMTKISTLAYRKNINENSDFIRYFKTVTPHLAIWNPKKKSKDKISYSTNKDGKKIRLYRSDGAEIK